MRIREIELEQKQILAKMEALRKEHKAAAEAAYEQERIVRKKEEAVSKAAHEMQHLNKHKDMKQGRYRKKVPLQRTLGLWITKQSSLREQRVLDNLSHGRISRIGPGMGNIRLMISI